jgi:hypothetical protein
MLRPKHVRALSALQRVLLGLDRDGRGGGHSHPAARAEEPPRRSLRAHRCWRHALPSAD